MCALPAYLCVLYLYIYGVLYLYIYGLLYLYIYGVRHLYIYGMWAIDRRATGVFPTVQLGGVEDTESVLQGGVPHVSLGPTLNIPVL